MKTTFLKSGYGLMVALVLTILVAGPYAIQASDELANQSHAEQVAGGPVSDLCG